MRYQAPPLPVPVGAFQILIDPDWFMSKPDAKELGWRCLAGEFAPTNPYDAQIAEGIVEHIQSTGGRIGYVLLVNGDWELWRPAHEMETAEETEERIAAWMRHKVNNL